MTELKKEVPVNLVPAAAVRQVGLALFVLNGRKGFVGGKISYLLNPWKKYRSRCK